MASRRRCDSVATPLNKRGRRWPTSSSGGVRVTEFFCFFFRCVLQPKRTGGHIVSGFTGFLRWILLGFSTGLPTVFHGTGFNWPFIGFFLVLNSSEWGFDGFYWVSLGFTRFYLVLLGFTVFLDGFPLCLTGLNWVLLGFTRFYWVSLGFIRFSWVLLSFYMVFLSV